MMTKVRRLSAEPVSVKRVGASVWVLRLLEPLELRAVTALREAFREAMDRDANDVVVDLADAPSVSAEGAAALAEMADFMRGRSGALWVAAPTPRDGYTLRLVREPLPDGLAGINPALDDALSALSAGVYSVREGSAILAERYQESPPDVSDLDVPDFAGVPA
jgi:anti-anti-sigma regulatory factor